MNKIPLFIEKVWSEMPGDYFFIGTGKWVPGRGENTDWQEHCFTRKQFKNIRKFLKDNAHKNLYWCPHGFSKNRRVRAHAVMPPLLWADLDRIKLAKVQPQPTYAWETSPKRYAALWLLDQSPESIELNKRMSKAHCEDGKGEGGWQFSKYLRIPGTTNHKYPTKPTVRLVISDGPTHDAADIDEVLPKLRDLDVDGTAAQDGKKIWAKYASKFKAGTRAEIFQKVVKPGKRSEVLWRLVKECIEAGMLDDEIFAVLWHSAWNKFRSKHNGDVQLRRDIEKARTEEFAAPSAEEQEDLDAAEVPDDLNIRSLADVTPREIDWIWYPYLARQELTILEGDPGFGKSYMLQMIALRITAGQKLPSVKALPRFRGTVLSFDIENNAETVLHKRATCNGFNTKLALKRFKFSDYPFSMADPDSLEKVHDALERHKPDLVIFDTVNTYIGTADTHKGSETQQALVAFVELAKQFNCSVCVVRHLNKDSRAKALYRGQGNIAYVGMARVVMTVGKHPEEADTSVMAVTKLNVTKKPKALPFRLIALPDTKEQADRGRLEFDDFVDLDADDILVGMPTKTEKTDDMSDFLDEILGDGEVESSKVKTAAEARGFSFQRLRRLHKTRGGSYHREGTGGARKVYWMLAGQSMRPRRRKLNQTNSKD